MLIKAVPTIPQMHAGEYGYECRDNGIIVKKHLSANRRPVPVLKVSANPPKESLPSLSAGYTIGPGSYDLGSTLRTDRGVAWGKQSMG